jgi:hypothetical protein
MCVARQTTIVNGCNVRIGLELSNTKGVHPMLYTIAVVLLILWLLGLVTSYTLGGFVHILLVVALIMIVFNVLSGRRASP